MSTPLTLEGIVEFLLQTPLFRTLSPSELAEIVRIMQVQHFRDGQTVFREGDPGDAWYVVFSGTGLVTKSTDFGPSRDIARLKPPSCFGEMAVLDKATRSATVSSIGDTTLLRFPQAPFRSLLEQGDLSAHKLVLGMAQVLCQRQRELTTRFANVAEDIAQDETLIRRDLASMLDRYIISG